MHDSQPTHHHDLLCPLTLSRTIVIILLHCIAFALHCIALYSSTMMKSLVLFFCVLLQSVASFTLVVPSSNIQNNKKTKWLSSSSFQLLAAKRDDDEKEYVKVPRRGGRRFYDDDDEEEVNSTDQRLYDDDDDEWDDDDDDDDDEEEYGLFSNVIIDNPLLDSIDPDGAAERFPELASDPRFWFDMVLFISFLNFLSAVGPRDWFPDIPW
jgi:hypothetical protein